MAAVAAVAAAKARELTEGIALAGEGIALVECIALAEADGIALAETLGVEVSGSTFSTWRDLSREWRNCVKESALRT